MNIANLKSYAPQARKDFISAVTGRANLLGLSEAKGQLVVAEAKASGDLVMIAGRPWPLKVNEQRNKLIWRMKQQGFAQTVESVAYAWFNRLAALRFMEVHDYLGHGRRVLSNPEGGLPEVLAHALDLAESDVLPGLSPDTVRELKLANQDAELYRLILIAQCNALHQAMPFLFEQLGDETELLLPENLLLTDSVVAKLVQSIPEGDWQQIEIIGWLYQFYISEKKEQVIGKVVKSEDIPAATQLFTPNWIVKYMVQNSLGAQWLATYPDSPLKAQLGYYIEPVEQTDEVNAQLAAITPSALNPEELTLIDPACGSGHILVEAYDLFKAIYLERGYRQRDVAQLILEKNLFGLDIDERAAQLTGFALMMKGRADDRQLFERDVKLNVMSLVGSVGFDANRLDQDINLAQFELQLRDLTELKRLLNLATTFGSLIKVPAELKRKLPALKKLSETKSQDLFVSEALDRLRPLVQGAQLLAKQYDVVAANPPYMGVKLMNSELKAYVKAEYPSSAENLCGCFIERGFSLAVSGGVLALVGLQNWMFQSSFEKLRQLLLSEGCLTTLVQIGFNSFPTMNSKVALAAAFCAKRTSLASYVGSYFNCNDAPHAADKRMVFEEKLRREERFLRSSDSFQTVPGAPISYWTSFEVRRAFSEGEPIASIAQARQGLSTSDNEKFVRLWYEVDFRDIRFGLEEDKKSGGIEQRWVPYNKGGRARKWYGNNEFVVDWRNDGAVIKGLAGSAVRNEEFYFKPSITWSDITITTAFRLQDAGFIFANSAHSAFCADDVQRRQLLGLLNSRIVQIFVGALSQTLHFDVGYYNVLPLPVDEVDEALVKTVDQLIEVARADWDESETSWNFSKLPLLAACYQAGLRQSCESRVELCNDRINKTKELEEVVDQMAASAYELTLDSPVSMDDKYILLARPTLEDCGKDLVSYVIGCMMGRYGMDAPGLIYAHSGNVGFDASRYTKFPADADGIVPITDELWFEDDAAQRIREFLLAVWGAASLEQNMAWLADTLGRRASETPDESIRRYLADKFFKAHLQTYKKRPIYWLFSSGKQGAFQALVYLHRYNAGTLARLRSEYVIPLTGKMHSRIEQLERDVASANSTAVRNRSNKQLESLRKKHLELLAYDEQLRHYADQRIELDLDDGVKVNYGKFGDLLADVKSVVGKQEED